MCITIPNGHKNNGFNLVSAQAFAYKLTFDAQNLRHTLACAMTASKAFQTLMQRVIDGSEEAAQELLRDFQPALLHAIRRRLNERIRSKFDSIDFVQDVWLSFFSTLAARPDFKTTDELIAFLTRVAENKVIDAVRNRVKTRKHDVNREQSLDDSRRFDKANLIGDDPTPSQNVAHQEEWGAFLRRQPLVYRRIFILAREGKTHEAIAAELGISRKTVQRVIQGASREEHP